MRQKKNDANDMEQCSEEKAKDDSTRRASDVSASSGQLAGPGRRKSVIKNPSRRLEFDSPSEQKGVGDLNKLTREVTTTYPARGVRYSVTYSPKYEHGVTAQEIKHKIGDVSKSEADFDFAIVLKRFDSVKDECYDGILPPTLNSKLFYKKNPRAGAQELIRRLHRVGLDTKMIHAIDECQQLIKVRASAQVLELGAEKIKMKKQRKIDSMWIEFSRDIRESLAEYDDSDNAVHFLDKERQYIVHNLITSDDGASVNEHSDLKCIIDQMLPLHKTNIEELRKNWITYWRDSHDVQFGGVRSCARAIWYCFHQPIDSIEQYFGEKIAFYFAWLEMYTRWLLAPTVIGILLFIQQIQSKSLDQPLAPFYALFMAIWASLFLVAWKRQANTLAYRWGVLGYEVDDEAIRPGFVGDNDTSSYPTWKRWLKYIVTFSVVVGFICGILALLYVAFTTRDQLQEESLQIQSNLTSRLRNDNITIENLATIKGILTPQFWFYFLIMPMLYGLCIPVFNTIFTAISTWMTQWENHKTESSFQSALIIKVFPFRCMHVFATLYYYAFTAGDNLLRVAIQLATFMLSGQMWNNVVKTGLPLLRQRYRTRQKQNEISKLLEQTTVKAKDLPKGHELSATVLSQCLHLEQASAAVWSECELERYDTFEDFTEMLIQFGYVSFFSVAFPLAPLLAFINNLISLRADAFKLCYTRQRPLATKASGIGIWFPVLQMMSIVAVITNCLHVAFTTTQIERHFPGITPAMKVWIVFIAEHSVVALQMWIVYVVPTIPANIKRNVRLEKELTRQTNAREIAARLSSIYSIQKEDKII